ncbi:DUF3168 domain-containing protein [Shimia litoralis]|uniref:DUF3168 domain-containing protein n=1 Tax=Shimia litoralis TaxID=420403 RepID=A0A4U7N505_9RHOB|nr:DUF3168 domain-containing protein [Shimia litoralis]TKZ20882.1 DUF3168 domain-containing protein [Shimia litoralis]
MSYAISAALQEAVFLRLSSDPDISALVGTAIYDAIPSGSVPETYVSLGAETVLDRSDQTGTGAEHRLTISVITNQSGFATAKILAGAISDRLHDADLGLQRGRLVFLKFDRAAAKRAGSANQRRIDMRFRARVEDNV